MDRILLFVSLFFSYAMLDEVKDNETLIYHWDVHHNIYYYCQFGTKEQIGKNFQIQCFNRNRHIQHILPDGTITFPYISYGSKAGFVLKCGDVPQAELHNCKKLLYTACSYNCRGSNITQEMTCQLSGPSQNVTARWSVAQPCIDNPGHDVQPAALLTVLMDNTQGKFTSDPRNSVETTSTTVVMAVANDNSSLEFASPGFDIETPKLAVSQEVHSMILLATIIPIVIVLVGMASFFGVYKWRRKPRKVCKQPTSSDEKHSYKDGVIVFSKLDAECKQPLVGMKGEDNDRKSSSGSDANTSQVSSEDVQVAAIINQVSVDDNKKIESALDDFVSLKSCFSTWEKTKQLIENDIVDESSSASPRPEQCCSSVSLLKEQSGAYRRNLRAQLEVISTRTREQALIGYMEQHMRSFGYQSVNELLVLEQTYERQLDEKVSDLFLRVLAGYDVKIGFIMEYFCQHKNWEAINVILQVHKDCPYCEQFRRMCEPFLSSSHFMQPLHLNPAYGLPR